MFLLAKSLLMLTVTSNIPLKRISLTARNQNQSAQPASYPVIEQQVLFEYSQKRSVDRSCNVEIHYIN